jgi:hypothetical protein
MWRPAEPKTSPTKRIFTERVYMDAIGELCSFAYPGVIKLDEDGAPGGTGVLAFFHGTEWTISTQHTGVGSAGE